MRLVVAQDARRQHTRSHVCSSARNVVQSVCVCLQALMETSSSVLAIITGRQREVALSVPKNKWFLSTAYNQINLFSDLCTYLFLLGLAARYVAFVECECTSLSWFYGNWRHFFSLYLSLFILIILSIHLFNHKKYDSVQWE